MAIKIQLRGDTLANWTEINPILAEREMVIETDTNKTKIGNGTDHYLDLEYTGGTDPISPNSSTVFSNGNLSLASRIGDVIYNIIDQFTGESFNITKTEPGVTVDGYYFFKVGEEYFKRNIDKGVNILSLGAIEGDNIANNSTNTEKILHAFDLAIASGCGKIYIPSGVYCVDPIAFNYTGIWASLEIFGDSNPAQVFGTVGNYSFGNGSSILKCNYTASYKSIISAHNNGGWTFLELIFTNVEFRTYENSRINAIDASKVYQLKCNNLQITTGVYGVVAIEPNYNSTGIITPGVDNAALTILDNISISGFYNAVICNEHTSGHNLNITCCKNALVFNFANHASYFTRICLQRNKNNIVFNGIHVLNIDELNIEHAATSQVNSNTNWQLTQADILDAANYGNGYINWHTVLGNVGRSNDFIKIGGENLRTCQIGLTSDYFTYVGVVNPDMKLLLRILQKQGILKDLSKLISNPSSPNIYIDVIQSTGIVLTNTEKDAWTTLYNGFTTNSIWDKILAGSAVIGGTLNAIKINFKTNTNDFLFSGVSWNATENYFASNGGVNQFLDTGVLMDSSLLKNLSMVLLSENNYVNNQYGNEITTNNGYASSSTMNLRISQTNPYFAVGGAAYNIPITPDSTTGIFIATKNSSEIRVSQNNVNIGRSATEVAGIAPNTNILIGASNGGNGTKAQIGFWMICNALTEPEEAIVYSLINDFKNSLSR